MKEWAAAAVAFWAIINWVSWVALFVLTIAEPTKLHLILTIPSTVYVAVMWPLAFKALDRLASFG